MSSSFNYWVIEFAVATVIMLAVGVVRYKVGKTRPQRRYRKIILLVMAGVFALIFTVMLTVESHNGILQLLDDNILGPGDSLAWSVFIFPFVVMFAGLSVWAFLYCAGVIASEVGRTFCKAKIYDKMNVPEDELK